MVATTEDKKKYKLAHKQVDKIVDSPCIQVCTYDEEEEFCIGCYRTKQELQDWLIMTREQKLKTLKNWGTTTDMKKINFNKTYRSKLETYPECPSVIKIFILYSLRDFIGFN